MPQIDPGPTQPMDPFSQKRSSSPSHGQQPPPRQSPPSSRQAPPPPPQQPSRSSKVDIRLAAQTDVGRQRTQNEDWVKTLTIPHFFNQGTAYICIVADGVGGEAGGEHASYTVVSILQEWLLAAQNAPPEDIPHYLSQAILAANQRLLEDMAQRPELEGMGSTVVVGLILGDRLYVAHVGDSRAYLVRNGHIYQLTVDHSWGQQALETGYLSPQEVAMHPNRNVLKRFLGTDEPLQVDTDIIEPGTFDPTKPQQWRRLPFLTLQPNDRLLFCTDGLSDMVPDQTIARIVWSSISPERVAAELIEAANRAGGVDNISVALAFVAPQEAPKEGAASPASVDSTASADPGTPRATLPRRRALPTFQMEKRALMIGAIATFALFLVAVLAFFLLGGEEQPPPTVRAGIEQQALANNSGAGGGAGGGNTNGANNAGNAGAVVPPPPGGPIATSTPLPTRTPVPTRTPKPTVPRSASGGTTSNTSPSGGGTLPGAEGRTIQLVAPANGAHFTLSPGESVKFEWRYTGARDLSGLQWRVVAVLGDGSSPALCTSQGAQTTCSVRVEVIKSNVPTPQVQWRVILLDGSGAGIGRSVQQTFTLEVGEVRPTSTPLPTSTPVPTNTPAPPPTNTPAPPTNMPPPPTNTPAPPPPPPPPPRPTNTPVPRPTNTPAPPPTNTPPPPPTPTQGKGDK